MALLQQVLWGMGDGPHRSWQEETEEIQLGPTPLADDPEDKGGYKKLGGPPWGLTLGT